MDDLWRILSNFEEYFHSLTSCVGHVIPKERSYGPVFDNEDSFILQVFGAQDIKIWENPAGRLPPFTSEDSDDFDPESLGEPKESVSMRIGDCLYLPRGFVFSGTEIGTSQSYFLKISVNLDNSCADWMVQNINTIISRTALKPENSFLR